MLVPSVLRGAIEALWGNNLAYDKQSQMSNEILHIKAGRPVLHLLDP
jgi:hypothetical protein